MATKVIAKSDTHAGLRDKLQAAVTAKHGTPANSDYYGSDAYVHDVTDKKVIHSKAGKDSRGKLFSSPYKVGDDGAVTLGEPAEVEPAYKPIAESERGLVTEAAAFDEVASKPYDPKTGLLTITIIKEGFNTSKGRFYSNKALRETGGIFAGAKMFANHATKQEESQRPEGRVQDWVANIVKDAPWLESDGRLRSKAQVHDADFKKKLQGLQEAGLLGEMGISIRAAGNQTPAVVQGVKTSMVESFVACKSVDFVTFPGAGGKVDMMESDGQHYLTATELEAVFAESDTIDIDLMPLAVLRERRPDLVAILTTEVRESYIMDKTVEQLKQELSEANAKVTTLTTEVAEASRVTKRATVTAELDKQLKEAGLPKVSEERIRKQFAEAVDVAGITEAIAGEKTYLKEAGVPQKAGVRGLGEVREAAGDDSDKKRKRVEYVEAMTKSPGWTKEMAEASADNLGL